MTGPTGFIKVSELGQLEDRNLVPELKKRLKCGQLSFITTKDCKEKIGALSLDDDNNKLDSEVVRDLWKLLVEDAITYLKMSDLREWKKDYGKPSSPDKMRSLKAFGVDTLYNYFIQFRDFERILYGSVGYYREHTLHVFRVWMLGALLLDDWFLCKKHPCIEFFDYVGQETGMEVSELITSQEIQAMWCIIALCHDLGYPLQKVDSINEQTRKMLRQYAKVNLQDLNFDVPQQHQFINDFILRFISSQTVLKEEAKQQSGLKQRVFDEKEKVKQQLELKRRLFDEKEHIFRTHVQSKYYLKYSKSLEDFQHGIFSSILLMKSLTYFLESDFDMDELKPLDYLDAKQCAIRREILRAVACHTCEEIYHIRPDTLGFLLIVCDELQSWGRPTFDEMQVTTKPSPTARLHSFSAQKVDYELGLPGDPEGLEKWAAKIFQRLHKMLRAAVDTPSRQFACMVTVTSAGKLPDRYVFEFKASKDEPPEFHFMQDGKSWNPWKEPDA